MAIATRIITDRKEIEKYIPRCIELARKSGCTLPFQYMYIPLLWYDHFHSYNGNNFYTRRGSHFLGVESWLENLYLIVSEKDDFLIGAIPIVSYSVKIRGRKELLKVLTFPCDFMSLAYHDFLIDKSRQVEVISSLLGELLRLLGKGFDLIFLSYIPLESLNLHIIREQIKSKLKEKRLFYVESVTSRRGGYYHWTENEIISYLKRARSKCNDPIFVQKINKLLGVISKQSSFTLLFSGTRKKIEAEINEILSDFSSLDNLKTETNILRGLMNESKIEYHHIDLPGDKDYYFKTLSYKTRKDLRRYRRNFVKNGGIFERIPGELFTEHDAEDYLNLHQLKWGDDSDSINNASYNFYYELSLKSGIENHLILYFATCNGRRIAALSCFDIFQRREAYIVGRDPNFDKYSIGSVLMTEAICDAIEAGKSIFDMGSGWATYKARLANNYSYTNNLFIGQRSILKELESLFIGYECMKFY